MQYLYLDIIRVSHNKDGIYVFIKDKYEDWESDE